MNDWGVIGHDWAVNRLKSAIASKQLAQSHLFVGPESVGKAALARAMASALLGSDERKRKLVASDKHPDLSWTAPDPDTIKVDVVRELLRTLSLAPVESTHRVAVIDQAQTMHDNAKNALLKTLEEPNPRVVLILIAPSVDAVLATISSRCQVLNLRQAPVSEIRAELLRRDVSPERAQQLARLSRGRVGWALAALADSSMLTTRAERIEHLTQLLASGATERFAYAEKLAKREGVEIRALLEEWLLFWRDVGQSYGQAHAATGTLRNDENADWIASLANALTPLDVRTQMRALARAVQLIEQNVNTRLTLDTLVLGMPRYGMVPGAG